MNYEKNNSIIINQSCYTVSEVCDQALAEPKIQKNEVNKNIQSILTDNIAILMYQQENYILIQ